MRPLRREQRPEGFLARRVVTATYAGAGTASRPFLSDALNYDRSGKLVFVADSRLEFVARETEAWGFSLGVTPQGNVASGETITATMQLTPGVGGSALNFDMNSLVSAIATNNYIIGGTLTLLLQPGDKVIPFFGSGLAAGNNPKAGSFFSGVRLG